MTIVHFYIDMQIHSCYFGIMSNDLINEVAVNLKKGVIITAIITLLISLLFLFLNRFSFICLDPDLCDKINKPLITNQP